MAGDEGGADAPIFAELMGLPGTQRYGALSLTPQQLRDRAIDAMVR